MQNGTSEPVSRDHVLRSERGQGKIIFPVQLTTAIYPVDPSLAVSDDHPYIRHRVSPEFITSYNFAYRWRSVPRVRRHRANSSQGSSSNGCCLCITMDKLMCASLFPHPLMV